MEQGKKAIRLNEVTLMRSVLALLIVFMHAFTCYNHSWGEPKGFVDVPLYKWLSRISFSFTLEAFVFISGYLFAFQRYTLNRKEGIAILIQQKIKRLILPSIVFSTVYFFFFYQYKGFSEMLYSIINGCGHMWFLPMLFWCFIGGWLLEQIDVNNIWKMVFLICLHLLAIFSLPMQLNRACFFMIYFYLGFVVYKKSEKIKSYHSIKRLLQWGWIFYILVFAVFRPLSDVFVCSEKESVFHQLTILVCHNACQLIYAGLGLAVFYFSAIYYVKQNQLKPFTNKLAANSFGIYLFQQFVLLFLYYKTSFSLIVGPYWLPWCGFAIAIFVSYILSDFLRHTKIGKFLIG